VWDSAISLGIDTGLWEENEIVGLVSGWLQGYGERVGSGISLGLIQGYM